MKRRYDSFDSNYRLDEFFRAEEFHKRALEEDKERYMRKTIGTVLERDRLEDSLAEYKASALIGWGIAIAFVIAYAYVI